MKSPESILKNLSTNTRLRVSKRLDEIKKVFSEAIREQIPVTLWQKDADNRSITEGHIIDMSETDLKIQFIKKLEGLEFNPQIRSGLYFHTNFCNVLFKQEIKYIIEDLLVVTLPNEIRIRELRDFPRTYFKYEDKKEIRFTKIGFREFRDKAMTARMFNISDNGVSFFISGNLLSSFKVGDTIEVKYIEDVPDLPEDLEGEIRHVSFFKKASFNLPETHAVGVQFNYILGENPRKLNLKYKSPKEDDFGKIEKIKKKRAKKEKTREIKVIREKPKFFLGHEKTEQELVLKIILNQNEEIGNKIIANNKALEYLQFINKKQQKMIIDYIEPKKLGACLKLSTKKVIDALLYGLPESDKKKIIDALQTSRHYSVVYKAQNVVLEELRALGIVENEED